MSNINFSKANCKNCYKCLRSCPVKAIKFENQQAAIDEERCIECGHCLTVCPQNAREIKSDLGKIKKAMNSGLKVIASLAPSFAGFFDEQPGKVVSALNRLGFSIIEETAVGAEVVAELYNDYIKDNKQEVYITTACPSANYLIEKYFNELIPYLIPVVSPMIAHGKLLKKKFGNNSFVVFIGPCLAKKSEFDTYINHNVIDAVLTFDELNCWINDSGIEVNEIEEENFNINPYSKGQGFPMGGGIIDAMGEQLQESKLTVITVSGMEDCMEVFNSVKDGDLKEVIIEASACKGSCVGGPVMVKNGENYFAKLKKVKNYIKSRKNYNQSTFTKIPENMNFQRVFMKKIIKKNIASEKEIISIMEKMGKYELVDELNCGVCGYNSCREKAQAVFEGMAETNMCLHYMRSKAESLANEIVENTVSNLILLDGEMNVREINPAAKSIFQIQSQNIIGKPISLLIDDEDFKNVRETRVNIIGKKYYYPKYGVVFVANIVYLPRVDMVLVSMINIMAEEKNKKELMKVKENTLNAAQEVIEKQMRVAQEIASLLGETTAETKIILTKLKKIVAGEDGE
ncbi:[Fe-Fe] hydrogenase large subunit C-terminal domain-containing protein [Clostridium lacusfryxellense]|uniref:[Fe-Fe] hydrogenase large subunit C-terminal domain-containing protein n=1 Tax=Clostridium lacusfryxellense TaxID=205328 RepID=UPI001C0A9B69|nr:[Fe-Fe] hydrogenase large subunit C-terminal domain-containing protein [Clostridium lacusfryxellense]MBU3113420.1 4Fe-4S binding protein [Clostridium lacusfryxellense]